MTCLTVFHMDYGTARYIYLYGYYNPNFPSPLSPHMPYRLFLLKSLPAVPGSGLFGLGRGNLKFATFASPVVMVFAAKSLALCELTISILDFADACHTSCACSTRSKCLSMK